MIKFQCWDCPLRDPLGPTGYVIEADFDAPRQSGDAQVTQS